MCGMNLIKYQAVSYKVRVAGAEGIFYYVKVVFHIDMPLLFLNEEKQRKKQVELIFMIKSIFLYR